MSVPEKGGDSFRKFYTKSFSTLLKVAYHITLDMDAAEDICQEAFIRFYNRPFSFPSEDQALYWLIRVVKNLSFNYRKRKVTEYRAMDKIKQEPERIEASGEDLLIEKETVRIVQEALEQLPEKYRSVLILKEYAGLNYQEIGRVLRISEGNVKVRVHRARLQLETLIQGEDVDVR
ncbi:MULTISPECIES: RNA polymerase sigma factor [Sediminispirochaeta]|jgi:RNA polymerase sigma-70 factor (ECF subfamily)|uniref:RNA polymerase, sigma-24 subunit, ECF subfamily n=1 Tax=Sediminispirochaeta smaragdinae (strain DSM 11293 / JCM 15392 / SEBR 4228) TaxID=573413 RepID=E1R387_SEDSS|nr:MULTISPECIES: RNA polymerase sigma factor [Sediminispirochaeta]ADK81273.1 RNA polymerase, sigma-24 subunit, ECF subfamily [Sediminispirochaeta smaragdinae DSM 11293]